MLKIGRLIIIINVYLVYNVGIYIFKEWFFRDGDSINGKI